MTGAKNLEESKRKALEALKRGTIQAAFFIFIAQMESNPETCNHDAIEEGKRLIFNGGLVRAVDVEKFFHEVV